MATVFLHGPGCTAEHLYLDRIPVPGEVIELSDGTLAQVTGTTFTPHRQGLDAVLGVGAVESQGRIQAEAERIKMAVQRQAQYSQQ